MQRYIKLPRHTMKLLPQSIAVLLFMLARSAAADPGSFGIGVSVDGEGFFLNPTLKSVKIEKVVPNSPAAKAGIKPGDLVLEIEGHPVAGTKADVLKPYLQREVGQSTRLLVKKTNGETVALVLVAAPKADLQ
jgi:C-terminal processing protease CtpA/Prc